MHIVRAAVPADAAAITRVHVTGWHRAYADLMPAGYLARRQPDDPERIERRRGDLARPDGPGRTVVAVDGTDDVVGFASFGPSRDDEAPAPAAGEVYAIYVDPDRLSTGIGRALMDHAVAALKARNLTPVRLWVLAGNASGIAFYERYGFRPDGGRGAFVIEQPGVLPIELPELRFSLDG